MKVHLITLIILLVSSVCIAQEAVETTVEQYIADMLEEYAAELDEEPDAESWFEELIALAERPLPINLAERNELAQLLFLSELQVENILYHRYTYGAFTSLYELQLVEGLDMTDIRRMLPFISLGEAVGIHDPLRWWEVKKYGRHELYLRNDFIPETKNGYRTINGKPSAYGGDRMHSHLKYRFDFRDRIRLNLTLEKDAGEPWWNKSGGGIDFSSASLQLCSVGPFTKLIIGDFTGSFGQGLVLRQGFNRSKSALATRVFNSYNGFKRYASTNEYAFLRGIAATAYRGKFGIHAFLSHRWLDAAVEDGCITSLYTAGYHRTSGEMEKMDRVKQQTAGTAITFRNHGYEIGLTTVYTHFNNPLEPEKTPYKYYYLRGNRQLTSGVNYRINWHGIQLFGETAVAGSAGTMNGFTISPSSRVSISTIHRFYPIAFNPFYASSFSAQSRIGNEHGVYVGLEILPARRWRISTYADSYRFSWLTYGVDAPSSGNDFLLQLVYSHSRRLQISLRNRYKQQYSSLRSESYPLTAIGSVQKWSSRVQLDYTTGDLQLRTVLEMNHLRRPDGSTTGYGSWQDISTALPGIPLKLSFRYLLFHIPEYDNRIYTYEKDVLHAFSSPSFSGRGSRCYFLAHYVVSRQLACWMKVAQVIYADGRTKTGTGNEEIKGSRRTDVHFLVRIQLRNH